jgi:mRNA interferase RelE/StbE
MRYEIIFSAEAEDDFRHLKANIRATVRDALGRFLRHAPTKTSKSRIKRLCAMVRPQYRLRVGNMRVFYDVTETAVDVLAIADKADADAWLDRVGERDETGSTDRSEE